jgi:epoxyqueuosine reductase
VLDAGRCLATWNLELKNEAPEALWAAQHSWAAGCDACQQVCPYNAPGRAAPPDAELAVPPAWHAMTLAEAIVLERERYDRDFRASALRRAGYRGLRLGAITAAAGMKDEAIRAALRACLEDPDEKIQVRAAWALGTGNS